MHLHALQGIDMLTYERAREHALSCGVDLSNSDAVPLDRVISRSKSGRGAWLARDAVHPEDMSIVYPKGYWIDDKDIDVLESIGVDYVILEK